MGVQSTLHVVEEHAQRVYTKVIDPNADAAFFREYGSKHFETMLDWILAESFYNVAFVDQRTMDEAMADYYKRTFGSYDPDGYTLESELKRVVQYEGMRYVKNQLLRLNLRTHWTR